MSIAQVPGHDSIITQLKTITGVEVYEGQYLTDGVVPKQDNNGLFPPYITVVFGASYAGTSRGIVTERYNTMRTTCTVYVVSPTDKLTRQYIDQVRDKLLAFQPVDGTPMTPFGGYDFVDADLGVNRYIHSAVFQYESNVSPF
jgi:hypothetical protein